VAQRGRIDVPALFDPDGRYRYLRGVNAAAIGAVASGVIAYSLVPDAWVKVLWGLAVSAGVYLALEPVQQGLLARVGRAAATTTEAA
jgi:cytosine/uracil/thiamine/allantoin permease